MKFKLITLFTISFLAISHALTIKNASGWFESAYVEWSSENDVTYEVYYSGAGLTDIKLDKQLVRNYGNYWRADAVGLKPSTYTLKIVPSKGSPLSTETLNVMPFDRSGFAFSNSHVPGAYNMDGTLKNGSIILYISESTKNTVSLDVISSSKGEKTTCVGLQSILNGFKKGYDSRPLSIRLLGNITDPELTDKGDILVDLSKKESSPITIEGIGRDATANGWGIRIKNAFNIEVRNIGIMNVNSGEGDNIGLQQDNQYIWVHNCDFFYGDAGSDADQVKGDGALDCKKSTYITFSYNHFWDTGKSNLLGLSENTTEGLYITYHHNWYDHSDSRHPRVRYYSTHVYNNYYDGVAKYGVGSTLGSSVFMEANYFRNCKYPMLTSMQGSDLYAGSTTSSIDNATFSKEAGGTIKAFNNKFASGGTFIAYGASTYRLNGIDNVSVGSINTKVDFDAYVVSKRDEQVPSSVVSKSGGNKYNNFDVNSAIMYSYKVDEPDKAKENVIAYAGRMQGGDFKWTFNESDDKLYAVNNELKKALVNYKGNGIIFSGESSVIITSSSSEDPLSSEKSSSSMESSSSSSVIKNENSSGITSIIDKDLVHNFTKEGKLSDFFEIIGNLSKDKGIVEFEGEILTQCLKMESSTAITFTLQKKGTLTLVLDSNFNNSIKVNGKSYVAKNGIVKVPLLEGKNEIKKGDSGNLFYISIVFDKDNQTQLVYSKNNNLPLHYNYLEQRLEINSIGLRHLSLFKMDGTKIQLNQIQKNSFYDLSYLKPGVYVVRAVFENSVVVKKINLK